MNPEKGRASGLFSFVLLVIAAALPAGAAADDATAARSLAATCANCHGTDGHALGSAVAPLAGRSKDEIVAQMKAFRDGSRPATVMNQLARGYTDRQVEGLAAYLAAQK